VLAVTRGEPVSEAAQGLVGLGAFGPALAALLVALVQRRVRGAFLPWRGSGLKWIVAALALLPALHLPAHLLYVALGGELDRWFYPPDQVPFVLALVFFSLGEEIGWRGFAYPRLADRYGPVVGSLILGTVWAVWHLGMMFGADGAPPTALDLLHFVVELAAGSVIYAWFLERGGRTLWLAVALHASAHLDNVHHDPDPSGLLVVLRVGVLVVAAAVAAWSLSRRRPE
jgi:membrane protease YdiL (CAAX protease family)